MTIGESISSIRANLKLVSDDSDFTNSDLYTRWKQKRAMLLNQRASKFHHISQWNTHTFCLALEKSKFHDCDCISSGCEVLKSKFSIPSPVSTRNKNLLRVTTLDGTLLPYRTAREIKSDRYDPIKCDQPAYDIQNQTLIIWNNLNYKVIRVEGVWADIVAFQDIQYCSQDNPCVDAFDLETGFDEHLESIVQQMVLQDLGITKQIRDDNIQDRNQETTV